MQWYWEYSACKHLKALLGCLWQLRHSRLEHSCMLAAGEVVDQLQSRPAQHSIWLRLWDCRLQIALTQIVSYLLCKLSLPQNLSWAGLHTVKGLLWDTTDLAPQSDAAERS